MVSDRVTEMEERTSTLEREDVSRQENAYRSCQNKGGTKRLQFVPLWTVPQTNSMEILRFLGKDGDGKPITLFQGIMLQLQQLSFHARNQEVIKYPLTQGSSDENSWIFFPGHK